MSSVLDCDCYFCENGRPHPTAHDSWVTLSAFLRRPESLDSKDLLPREACTLCGHVRLKV